MEKAQFVFRSWNDLRSHDRRAYEAIRRYAEDSPNGPWALREAEDQSLTGERYIVTLFGTRSRDVLTVVFVRQGNDYFVESSSL